MKPVERRGFGGRIKLDDWIPVKTLKAITRHLIESSSTLFAFWLLHLVSRIFVPADSPMGILADKIEQGLVVATIGLFALFFFLHLLQAGFASLKNTSNAASFVTFVF